jgi:hypothetical protein
MTSLVRALTGTDKGTHDFVAALLILLGGFLIIGSYIYRVFVEPEWTFEEATFALWPYFTAGGVMLVLGWLVDRTGDAVHRPRSGRLPSPPSD